MLSVSDSGTRDGAHMCSIKMVRGDVPCPISVGSYQLLPSSSPRYFLSPQPEYILSISHHQQDYFLMAYICTLIFSFTLNPLFYHKACGIRLFVPWHHRTHALTLLPINGQVTLLPTNGQVFQLKSLFAFAICLPVFQ
jgi:hypothetical protein